MSVVTLNSVDYNYYANNNHDHDDNNNYNDFNHNFSQLNNVPAPLMKRRKVESNQYAIKYPSYCPN